MKSPNAADRFSIFSNIRKKAGAGMKSSDPAFLRIRVPGTVRSVTLPLLQFLKNRLQRMIAVFKNLFQMAVYLLLFL